MTLPDRIRPALAADHTAVEATAFARAMVGGTITAADYAAGLSQLHRLHSVLETALESVAMRCPEVAAVYAPTAMNRTKAVENDLAALGFGRPAAPGAEVSRLTDQFVGWAFTTPWALLGPLYVMEGSRMGSMVMLRTLGPALGVERRPGVGLDYHLDGVATRPQDWQRFRAALAALPLTAAQQDDALAAAVATMRGLVEMYAALPVGAPAVAVA